MSEQLDIAILFGSHVDRASIWVEYERDSSYPRRSYGPLFIPRGYRVIITLNNAGEFSLTREIAA